MKNKKQLLIILVGLIAAVTGALLTNANLFKISKNSDNTEDVILTLPADFLESATQTGIDGESFEKDILEDGFLYSSNKNGTCCLIGVSDTSKTELNIPSKNTLGETVIKIEENAFKGCKKTASITIPSTVKDISPKAFIDCDNLIAIMTSSSNTKFCSVGGVLFSKDKTVLICYPANRVGSYYLLSENVKKIEAYAFYSLLNLENIFYTESAEKFTSIHIGIGNDSFSKLPITCNYIAAKK